MNNQFSPEVNFPKSIGMRSMKRSGDGSSPVSRRPWTGDWGTGRPPSVRELHPGRFAILMVFALTLAFSFSLPAAEHVVIIGVDGLSAEGVRIGNLPTLKKLMKNGAYSLHARAVRPTSSSPNWASMIMGAGPEQHGVTSNDWETNRFESNPVKTSHGIFPTIFWVLKDQKPQAHIACFHDWDGFGRLVERNSCNVLKHVKDAIETSSAAAKYFSTHRPTFLFVHFDGVDHAGHSFGWKSPQYAKAIELTDSLISAILETIEKNGLQEQTVLLVTSDHGGIGTRHGGDTLQETEIPWIITGPGIRKGIELKQTINTYDTAPTLAHLLGLKPPPAWIGKPVLEAFKEGGTPDRNSK